MSPPQLSGYTPVAHIVNPVVVNLIHSFRNKFNFASFNNLAGTSSHVAHLNKPLRLYKWLNCSSTSIMSTYHMSMRNCLYKKSLSFKVFKNCLSCLISVHSMITSIRTVNSSVIIHNIYLFKVMSLTNLKVVRVMSRCNLNTTSSELLIYIRICNNRNLSVNKRKKKSLTNDISISLIIRINGNCSITQKCFRTSCSYLNKSSFFSNYWIINMPEMSFLLFMYNLCIRNSGLTNRTPVNNT